MRAYSDAELEAMLLDLESDRTERKESFKAVADKVREAVCAFANDLPDHRLPGVVFIGARDDGSPSGLGITDELLLQLSDIKTDGNIVPPPTLSVAKRFLNGAEMAVIAVQTADSPPVRYRGRIHIRIGPRRGIASAQDERILNEKRRYRDRPFELHPIQSAATSDLNLSFFAHSYLPGAFAADILAANDRSTEQRLAATKMIVSIDEPTPTALGMLVLGLQTRDFIPGAYVEFLRIAGGTPADPIEDEQAIDGAIHSVINRLDDKLAAHNRTRVDLTTGPVEKRKSTYPMPALQQLTRSALLHRTYEATNTPVRVYWYEDRIDIVSPGGPFGVVTPENFGEPGVTDYRNPNLTEALRVLGYVQRFGAGIPIARRALASNGNPPPEFNVHPTYLSVTVRPAL
jgi:ATP-dependent DNA helicase RecG